MVTTKYPRGSEWRKWDLHVHTPASGLSNGFHGDWDNYVKVLFSLAIERGVAAIGITDYFTIEGYEKIINDYIKKDDKLLELFGSKEIIDKVKSILLLPNIEFRLDKMVGQNRVNYHVIFSNEVEIEEIKENFLQEIEFVYEAVPFTKDNTRKLTKHNLEELGKKIKVEQPSFSGNDFEVGCTTAIVQDGQIRDILDSHADLFKGKYLIVVPVDEDLADVDWHNQGHQFRKVLYQQSNIFFSSNTSTIKFGLGMKHPSKEEFLREFKSFKPCVIGCDAHSIEMIKTKLGLQWESKDDTSKTTWIKADPTFEGLKQILYEPEDRVRIQSENPTYDREKFPFTNIFIPTQTKVFAEEDDIYFEPSNIPLNNNLVSIIGGRGTGKSQLVNYLAASFNKDTLSNKYNLSSDIVVSRKASITEESIDFKVKDSPNVPFMYIAQSQIKELVEKKDKFSRNILETIGVTDEYRLSMEYSELAEATVNEYHRIIKVLNADDKTSQERKDNINKEIKRYSDFIQNITSEQNRKKLEDYKKKVENLHTIKSWQEKVNQLLEKNKAFADETNAILKKWNEQLAKSEITIPLIDIQPTQNGLSKVLLPHFLDAYNRTEKDIENTKNEFRDYKGDLTTLLSNVSSYQNKLSELIKQKDAFEQEERKYQTLSSKSLKSLGSKIRKSIEDYTELIRKKWSEFKGENDTIDPKKKELLDIILQKDLDVEAVVSIDTEKMYNLLLDKLDGRSYNIDRLSRLIGINTIDDFYRFVCQESSVHVFSTQIREDLRKQILYLFYKRYTDFISIGVKVTLNKKPITKLSYGQQGTIYLRLQIAANMFSETIIYDQPEDDLDNDFITNELIPIFKKIKLYRQIIIVSHNANLVVNADSEQVIIAKNVDGKLSYVSGSLEDPTINAKVCRILEGGKTAFEDRERKYKLSDKA